MDKIEKNWESIAKSNPYYAVVTFDKFDSENINTATLENFFDTGEKYVESIWKEIEDNFLPNFRPQKSLDFGCGVARLTLPIAKRSETVIGVDISENMLNEARQNAENFGIKNALFIKGDNQLSKVSGEFDFVHSFIVFQHIKPEIGEAIFEKLVKSLAEGGIGVLHFTYSANLFSASQKFRSRIYRDFTWIYRLRNLLRGRNDPFIQMYLYDLNRLFGILQENDCHKCQIRFSQHGNEGALLFFQKRKEILY